MSLLQGPRMVVSLGLEAGYLSPGALVLRAARPQLQYLHHVCGGVLAAGVGTGYCLRDVAVELCRCAEGALYSLADNRRSTRPPPATNGTSAQCSYLCLVVDNVPGVALGSRGSQLAMP